MSSRFTRRSWLAGTAALPAAEAFQPLRLPRKVRLALIGLDGHTGEILGPLKDLPDVELTAIADPNPRARAGVLRNPRATGAREYGDYRQMLEREPLDVVGICGSNGDRADQIVACAERKLHVAAEKPLAVDRAGFERVKQAVKRNGIRLTMLLPMRFWPAYAAIRQIVQAGEIGEVAQISGQKSYKVGERPQWMRRHATFGGTIPFIGIHMVDLMRFTSGRELVEAVSFQNRIGFPELGDMENTTGTLFRLDNGGVAVLRMDYLRPETAPTHGDDRIRLAGTRGIVEYQESTGVTLVTRSRKPRVVAELPPPGSLFTDFLKSVYLGEKPSLTLFDIYQANQVVLAARESAERHEIVPVRRDPDAG